MPSRLLLGAALAALLLPVQRAAACSVCAAGDPLVAAADAASGAHELRVGLETEWLTAEADMAEEGEVGRERVEQGTLRFLAVYSPVDDVNLVAQVPLVWKTSLTTMPGMAHPAEELSGLGDVDVGGRWFVVNRSDFARMRHHALALSAGSSLPTGRNDARDGAARLDEHAQLGTGAYGPYLGALYRLEGSSWHAFASLTGRLRTENEYGYRYGGALAWTVQAQRSLGTRLALSLGVDGRWAAADREEGEAVGNTGGLVLAAVPQLHVDLGRGVWASVRAQVPFATALRGAQDVGPTFVAGLQYRVF